MLVKFNIENSCMYICMLLTDCTVSMYALDAVSGDQTSFIFLRMMFLCMFMFMIVLGILREEMRYKECGKYLLTR